MRAGRCAACRLRSWPGCALSWVKAAVHGWAEDQRRTLERAAGLIARLFHVRYALRSRSYLLHRIGFTPQAPAHLAAERDEAAIAPWRDLTWVKLRGQRRRPGRTRCFEDEAGQTLRPAKARTWGRRGRTPPWR